MAIYTWSSIQNFAGIDYQDFIKIYRECTQKPYNCLTIDTTLLVSDPLGFRFSFVEVLFTNQTSKALQIADNVILTLIFG